jgi:hypothetical protein
MDAEQQFARAYYRARGYNAEQAVVTLQSEYDRVANHVGPEHVRTFCLDCYFQNKHLPFMVGHDEDVLTSASGMERVTGVVCTSCGNLITDDGEKQ